MAVAGDLVVGVDEGAGYAVERLLEVVRRGYTFGEGDGVIAEVCFGVEEDGFVDQVLLDEGTVELSSALEQNAEDLSLGEGAEDGGEAEAAGVFGYGLDVDSSVGELCDFFARG